LSAEIKNILKFHAEHSDKQVTKVLLSGGSSKLKNLAEFLGPQLAEAGISKVELANPWQNFSLVKNFPLSPFDSLGFVITIGLAIRGQNFEIV
jgi:Tfp pilus assembly PilM family ATPase